MAFKALGLNDRLVQGILATGYTAPTEIQARAIPAAVAGKDIIGCAQTGTGKTAAFTLPILNRLAEKTEKTHHIKALVLTPTRELAQQIEDAVKQYGRFLSLRALSVYGGTNMQNQLRHLSRGVDILIATPGRLIDHLERRSVNLSHVEVLVLDEADRMFDMGFIDDMRLIIKQTPETRQTLLFSATMSKQVRMLVKDIQKSPELIEVGERRTPATTVTQHFFSVNDDKKLTLLLHILKEKELDSVLVFSKTKVGAERVSTTLHKNGIKAVSIHSDRTQAQRQRALAGFKQGQYKVMVATDVAARGIDVDGISHVINYDIPTFAEDYIHRIGRTGRAQTTGDALTFVTRSEARHVKKIEQFIGKRFEIKKYPGFDYTSAEVTLEKSELETGGNEHRGFRSGPRTERKSFSRPERSSGTGRPGFGARPERREGFKRDDRREGFRKDDRHDNSHRPERRPSFERTEHQPREAGERKEFSKPRSFNNAGTDNTFKPRTAPAGERSFGDRKQFGKGKREGGFGKRPSFGGDRREGGFGKRDMFGPKKRGAFPTQKRDHSFTKQEAFTDSSSFAAPKRFGTPKAHGGPDWRQLIPGEQEFRKREHKVVKKMVSRKKKDS
ncbi:MAG: DEAD/DEAH box helicase [Bacteroidetes bacterium]|nr:DEAD/DEAH box helicase [Bacteroidota bacterium]